MDSLHRVTSIHNSTFCLDLDMADIVGHDLPHWRFYMTLEEDLEKCFRFIPLAQDHHNVYSDEFAKIILLAATEFENTLQEFKFWSQISYPENSSISENITGYYIGVTNVFPNIVSMQMIMPRYSLMFSPLSDWSNLSGPDWWAKGYNKIKHGRLENPTAPTMIRALKAVGALQVLLLHYYRLRYKKVSIPWMIASSLIVPYDVEDQSHGAFINWVWELPDDPKETFK